MAFSREQKRNAENRSGRESSRLEQESKKDLIVKREFHPAILLFLILYLAIGSEVLPLALSYVITLLLFGLENLLGYLHVSVKTTFVTTCVVPSVMLGSGRDKRRLETTRDEGSLKVVFKGTRMLGVSTVTLDNDWLHKRFQRVYTRSAHSRVAQGLLEIQGQGRIE